MPVFGRTSGNARENENGASPTTVVGLTPRLSNLSRALPSTRFRIWVANTGFRRTPILSLSASISLLLFPVAICSSYVACLSECSEAGESACTSNTKHAIRGTDNSRGVSLHLQSQKCSCHKKHRPRIQRRGSCLGGGERDLFDKRRRRHDAHSIRIGAAMKLTRS